MIDLVESFVIAILTVGPMAYAGGRKIVERRRARRELRSRPRLGPGRDAGREDRARDEDLAEGVVVRVTGVVRAEDELLVAPLTGRRGVLYRARFVHTGSGFGRRALRPYESFAMVAFTLARDGDGVAVAIEGRHALLDLPDPKLRRFKTPDARARRLSFLLRHGLKDNAHGDFDEVVLAPGTRVTIAGLLMKDLADAPPEGEADYRAAASSTLRLAGDVAHPLVIGPPDE